LDLETVAYFAGLETTLGFIDLTGAVTFLAIGFLVDLTGTDLDLIDFF
tara:strand:- start:45 stop:188 length:144 start_codon:yes stop_codon:yes gene_type:complete